MGSQLFNKILIIDDEPAIRNSFRFYLEDLDYIISEAENGRIGLEKFYQEKPDLILVDLRMPEIDGLTVLEKVTKQSPDTPVIVISGGGHIGNVVQALRLGAWDYIVKPVEDLSVLHHAIQKALERYGFIIQNQAYQGHLEEEVAKRTNELEKKANELKRNNTELEKAQIVIEEKVRDLELSNRYKSEFLANMSHELRTPLNSILLLSKLLSENRSDNLTEKQIEFLTTINSSGTSLLEIINDILDLSKIEAGKMELWISQLKLNDIKVNYEKQFTPFAKQKGIEFTIEMDKALPDIITTDPKRLAQILKNLLSNAFKFTDKGGITLKIERPRKQPFLKNTDIDPEKTISFSVIDTGIGILKDKRNLVFEAFRQVDGSINRKYGGTGLGLSISKKLAQTLGGDIYFQSKSKKGTTFTLILPEKTELGSKIVNFFTDTFIDDLHAKEIAWESGLPDHKDNKSSDKTGSESDSDKNTDFLCDDRRNLVPEKKTILIVENDIDLSKKLRNLFRNNKFNVIISETGETSLHLTDYYRPDIVILAIELPGIDGWTVMKKHRNNTRTRNIPVCFISSRDKKQKAIDQGCAAYFNKIECTEKPDYLIHQISSILSKLPASDVNNENSDSGTSVLENKKILIVDDDMRNVYAILNVLQENKMKIIVGRDEKECMEHLSSNPDIGLVVMDTMMPGMKGYKLIQKIRKNKQYNNLPIIVLTAKVMRGERSKCIQYGASDWLAKPVDIEKLLSMMRVWLQPELS